MGVCGDGSVDRHRSELSSSHAGIETCPKEKSLYNFYQAYFGVFAIA